MENEEANQCLCLRDSSYDETEIGNPRNLGQSLFDEGVQFVQFLFQETNVCQEGIQDLIDH
jgi:hypothetical protein